jgi:hypothetical protein
VAEASKWNWLERVRQACGDGTPRCGRKAGGLGGKTSQGSSSHIALIKAIRKRNKVYNIENTITTTTTTTTNNNNNNE